jgi:hypothetical protein
MKDKSSVSVIPLPQTLFARVASTNNNNIFGGGIS